MFDVAHEGEGSFMKVLLVGVGPIGIEYAKILREQGHDVIGIGRSQHGCDAFEAETGVQARAGGLDAALAVHANLPDRAIVAVSEANLGAATRSLLQAGLKKI